MHIIKQEICKLIKSPGRHNTQNVKRGNHTRMNGTGIYRTGMNGTDLIGPYVPTRDMQNLRINII